MWISACDSCSVRKRQRSQRKRAEGVRRGVVFPHSDPHYVNFPGKSRQWQNLTCLNKHSRVVRDVLADRLVITLELTGHSRQKEKNTIFIAITVLWPYARTIMASSDGSFLVFPTTFVWRRNAFPKWVTVAFNHVLAVAVTNIMSRKKTAVAKSSMSQTLLYLNPTFHFRVFLEYFLNRVISTIIFPFHI